MNKEEKLKLIESKRQNLIKKFKENDWKPNIEYFNSLHPSIREQVKIEDGSNGGWFYFLSPCREFAVTIKQQVVHIYAKSRKFAKVLNIEIIDCEINEEGISQGLILLKWR